MIKSALKGEFNQKLTGTKWDIFRDVWCFGPPNNGYPGAFPRGLLSRLKKMEYWGEQRLWLFSGSHKDKEGITVDIKPELKPDVICNCEKLPFANESFDFVMLDPPYSEKEAMDLYGLGYTNILKVINEAARVCKTGGLMILLHRLIPFSHPEETIHKKRMKIIACIGVYTIAGYSNMRGLSVWRKMKENEESLSKVKNYKKYKNQKKLFDK